MAAPPRLWQREVASLGREQARVSAAGQRSSAADGGEEKLSETWRHVKGVARDESKHYDLMDLVRNARREDTYQFPVAGWPSLLRPLSSIMPELPAMVQDKYRTCQTMCFCGVLPQIRRTWASVDNSLYLWRYDRSNDVPVEYCGEEQAICCVGLAKPKPGVFLAAIQHVLVLATTVEIVLLGVCTSPSKGGGSDPYEELSLQPMPLYTLPSDNTIMTCFASSASGRIFMGANDGNVYEIQYAATDSWRQRRCSKARVTGGIQQLLPGFLVPLFGQPIALDKLVVDDERHILYSLASNSAVQVFDLGATGSAPANKVAELSDFLGEVARLPTGRTVFALGDDKWGTAIKYLAVIPMAESWKVHLMAVTSNGRRAYFSTSNQVRASSTWAANRDGRTSIPSHLDPKVTRPNALVAIDARGPLPQPPAAGVRMAADPASRPMDVTAVLYTQGTLVLAEASGSDGTSTKLLMAARNHTLPPATVNVNFASGAPGLREMVSDLDSFIPGETAAIGCIPQSSVLGPEVHPSGSWGAMQDELVAQMFSGPQQLVVVSTAGVLELERRRPVDVLQALLAERSADKLKQFFDAYGAPEAAAMCYLIGTQDRQSMRLVEEAANALDNPQLVGQPLMPEEGGGTEAAQNAGSAGGGIYMGTAVNPNPEPGWSGAHKGLALYISRLLAPVWDHKLITPSSGDPNVWMSRLSDATMMVLEAKLRELDKFLQEAAARRKNRGFGKSAGGVTAGAGPTGLFGHLEDGTNRMHHAGGVVAGAAGASVAGVAPAGMAAAISDAPFAKRQRMWNAFVMEEQRNNAVRTLASKAAQALVLLRTIAAANVNRLVNRLDAPGRRALQDANFRDLVLEDKGSNLAAQLVAALVADQLEGGASGAAGGVAELAAALQAGAPAYFRDQDRQFFQATAKLKAAEQAATAAERDAAAKEALAGLLRVPQCVNLGQMIGRLAFLRQYQGIVELVVQCAAIADPHDLAWRHSSSADTAAARAARDRCYSHLLGVLKPLLGVGNAPRAAPTGAAAAAAGDAGAGGAGAGAPEEGALLTPAEAKEAKNTIVQAILQSGDQYLIQVLYSTLVDVRADSDLLANPNQTLITYLRSEGGLSSQAGMNGSGGLGGGDVGPLSSRQVIHLELLARLHIKKSKYGLAANVYLQLASRRNGTGDAAVSLQERLDALHNALLQARSVGDEQLTDTIRASVQCMTLQISIRSRLQQLLTRAQQQQQQGASAAGPSPDQLSRLLKEIQNSSLDVSDLYNSYAQPLGMWDMCLQICNFAGSVPSDYVRQLWDLLLKEAWETGGITAPNNAAKQGVDSDTRLERCCDKVQELGVNFYPNEGSLPLAHVTLRLESAAAGLWPKPADSVGDPSRVVRCLRAVLAPSAGDNASSVVASVYEQLLARRGALLDGGVAGADIVLGSAGDGAARSALRLGLLKSLVAHCRIVLQEELSSSLTGQPDHGYPSRFLGRAQQAAALADLAERCASEARSLGGDAAAAGQQLAEDFDRIAAQLATASNS